MACVHQGHGTADQQLLSDAFSVRGELPSQGLSERAAAVQPHRTEPTMAGRRKPVNVLNGPPARVLPLDGKEEGEGKEEKTCRQPSRTLTHPHRRLARTQPWRTGTSVWAAIPVPAVRCSTLIRSSRAPASPLCALAQRPGSGQRLRGLRPCRTLRQDDREIRDTHPKIKFSSS